jgi:uncharacterized protein YqgV (UPF0045/DUF77 family)
MSNKVNIAIQVLPKVDPEQVINVIDKAIEVIIESGIKYRVCPFETVMEGTYDEILKIVDEIKETCMMAGAEEILINLKMQIGKDRDILMDDKTLKFEQ